MISSSAEVAASGYSADTYGDVQDLPAHQIKRLPGALNDLLMNMFHTFVPTRIINGHAVDITGQVADDHIIPVKFLQKRAKLLYQFVPRHDSQSVIYLAEIININNKQCVISAFGIGFYILINPLNACISVIDMKYRINLDFFF